MQKHNIQRSDRPTSSRSAARWPKSASPANTHVVGGPNRPGRWPRDPHPDGGPPPLGGDSAQEIRPDEARRIVDEIEF